ncbi:MAG: efflux RND transporter periplasmic adaptor subunit [Desulfoprunum sp.]|uniref:efflux RND transporter periplasmic adaptor subunit n=1 Tax=Desulfoprunum sp. TaxID=2020866 RepID=UPI003C72E6F3
MMRWLALFILAGAVAVLVWVKTRPQPLEIIIQPVVRGKVEQTVANTRAGTVEACRRAKLSPSIGGQIGRLPIREGDHVETGDLLLEIWNEDLAAQLKLAELEEQSARAQAAATCLSAAEAERQARRTQQLRDREVVPEEDADRALTQAGALRAQCEAARAGVTMSAARIDVARAGLSRTRLIAPFAGVVAKIEGELNEYVTPSPVGVQTPPAVDLIEDNCFYVTAPIDEVDAAAVRVGMTARITLDAFKGRQFVGKVRRIAPYVLDVEKQARTVDVEASFVDKGDFKDLLAGYSADVEIILATKAEGLYIPTEALIDGKRVYLYSPEKKTVHTVEVTTGLANWAVTEIVAGLAEGQQVVVNVDKPGLADGAAAVPGGGRP